MATPQPAARRRQRQRADARRAILDATEALLLENGPAALSMRRLAQRCGYTAPTIYHYFGDKQGLVDTVLEERFRSLVTALKRARRDDPVDNLRSLTMAFARFGLRNPEHYTLLTTPRDPAARPLPAAEAALELLSSPLEQLASESRLRVDDVDAVRQAFWALLHGVISLRTSRPGVDWSRSLLSAGVDALIRGFVADAPPPARRGREGTR